MKGVEELLRELRSDEVVMQPSRLAILFILALEGRQTFKQLLQKLGMSPGNLGTHLNVLEREGLVEKSRCLSGLRYVNCFSLSQEGMRRLARLMDIASTIKKRLDGASRP